MSAPVASAITRAFPKALPVLITGTTVLVVGAYVKSQLSTVSNKMDGFFSTYNTPESEAARRKSFEGYPDTRSNILNILSWK